MSGPGETSRDPERFLREARREQRGKLKLFFGAAPGVGKTYTMLQEAGERRRAGVRVLVGWVDTHGRKDTEAQLAGLEVLPRRVAAKEDFEYQEFDLDETLRRRPELVVVDELAHHNAPGSRHPKRWQDVEELLASGIDVYTALNVQHLESVNDVVGELIGTEVRETVPDRLFDEADEVRLVDLPPADLIARLKAGKVYLRQTVEAALRGFFKKSNLLALRDLSLRYMSRRADAEANARRAVGTGDSEGVDLLLWLSGGAGGAELIRRCARMAASGQLSWQLAYFDGDGAGRDQSLIRLLALARDLGARCHPLRSLQRERAVCELARRLGARAIVVDKDQLGWWRYRRLSRAAAGLTLMELSCSAAQESDGEDGDAVAWSGWARPGWWQSVALTALASAVLYWLEPWISPINAVMLFLLPILASAALYGTAPGVFTALLSSAVFLFLFVDPPFSFAVSDFSYLIIVAVMLIVGTLTGTVIAHARLASERERDAAAQLRLLLDLSRELAQALLVEEAARIVTRHAREDLRAGCELWLSGGSVREARRVTPALSETDRAIVLWCVEHERPAGRGSNTLPAAPYCYLPLIGQTRAHGVLVLSAADPDVWLQPRQRRAAEAVADLTALALERLHYIDVAKNTMVEIESERFRHWFLRELSEDLRQPLRDAVAEAEALSRDLADGRAETVAEARSLLRRTRSVSLLVSDLFELARLQSDSSQRLEREPVGPRELFEAALSEVRETRDEPLEVVWSVADDTPPVPVDRQLMVRLCGILIDFAARRCPQGIELGAEKAAGSVVLSVRDSGPALPEEELGRLFDPFSHHAESDAAPGVGLGLALCRTIARTHGARLLAGNGQGGVGCVLTLILPLPSSDAA